MDNMVGLDCTGEHCLEENKLYLLEDTNMVGNLMVHYLERVGDHESDVGVERLVLYDS